MHRRTDPRRARLIRRHLARLVTGGIHHQEAALSRDKLVAALAANMQTALDRHQIAPGALHDGDQATPTGVLLAETALDHLTTYIEHLL